MQIGYNITSHMKTIMIIAIPLVLFAMLAAFRREKKEDIASFESIIQMLIVRAKSNKNVQQTLRQWLQRYENLSLLQVRLLDSSSDGTRKKSDFAHQMIEEQKIALEKQAQQLLFAIQEKDQKKIAEICAAELDKKEAVDRAFQQRNTKMD